MFDIYFEPNYGVLNETTEKGECKTFEYRSSFGSIYHMFIQRKISLEFCNSIAWYDIVTPYGYGGPMIIEVKNEKKNDLLLGFANEFREYCIKSNIVCEFVRFHPILGNAQDFSSIYQTFHIRNTIGTNLEKYNDPFRDEFSKSCRRNIQNALNNSVSYRFIEKPECLDFRNFKKVYYSTMDRNNASSYYYFDDFYFDQCQALFPENVLFIEAIFNGEVIAMGMYFTFNSFIHCHLSGTLSQYLYLSPAYVLRYALVEWAIKHNYKLIHHGGGRTNDHKDGLYLFKKQFGVNTEFSYSIGKKIWNEEIYYLLLDSCGEHFDTEYFPAYRLQRTKID